MGDDIVQLAGDALALLQQRAFPFMPAFLAGRKRAPQRDADQRLASVISWSAHR
jgi:hypothetical protein